METKNQIESQVSLAFALKHITGTDTGVQERVYCKHSTLQTSFCTCLVCWGFWVLCNYNWFGTSLPSSPPLQPSCYLSTKMQRALWKDVHSQEDIGRFVSGAPALPVPSSRGCCEVDLDTVLLHMWNIRLLSSPLCWSPLFGPIRHQALPKPSSVVHSVFLYMCLLLCVFKIIMFQSENAFEPQSLCLVLA